jgi:hypothetical protein
MNPGTKIGLAAAVLAAGAGAYLAAAPDAEIPEGGVCELHTVFGPCEDLLALPGADNVPTCDPGDTVGAVIALKLLPGDENGPALDPGWLRPPGLFKSPVDCGAYDFGEAPEARVLVVPVSTMHPESIAGLVARTPDENNEGGEPAHLGYCYGRGCHCVGTVPCENVAIGAVDQLYWQKRLCRLYTPETTPGMNEAFWTEYAAACPREEEAL